MQPLLPHLFRTEYRKLTVVLTKLFGFAQLEVAEDIVSDTFLAATALWPQQGLPDNPVAWLYTVAKNKARDHLKREGIFREKVSPEWSGGRQTEMLPEPDLSPAGIADSQLQMMFAIVHPAIPAEAQIGLALRILCGFGIEEVAAAFLTSKDTINKRLHRAKEKLRSQRVQLVMPVGAALQRRLGAVLQMLYLLFNEGYFAYGRDTTLRKDLCLEAMRLGYALAENPHTARPEVYALLALMCFQASRFDARLSAGGEGVLYAEQDSSRWDAGLITQGSAFLLQAREGAEEVSKFHLEAAIAWWHTSQEDHPDKWKSILRLYDALLEKEEAPIAALSRVYALYRVEGKAAAIRAARALPESGHHLYHSLLGELYAGEDDAVAAYHLQQAILRSPATADKTILQRKLEACKLN